MREPAMSTQRVIEIVVAYYKEMLSQRIVSYNLYVYIRLNGISGSDIWLVFISYMNVC